MGAKCYSARKLICRELNLRNNARAAARVTSRYLLCFGKVMRRRYPRIHMIMSKIIDLDKCEKMVSLQAPNEHLRQSCTIELIDKRLLFNLKNQKVCRDSLIRKINYDYTPSYYDPIIRKQQVQCFKPN